MRTKRFGSPLILAAVLAIAAPALADSGSPMRPGRDGRFALEVLVQPEGAAVSVDDAYIGTTPLRGQRLAPGAHLLRIEKAGFQPRVTRLIANQDWVVEGVLVPVDPEADHRRIHQTDWFRFDVLIGLGGMGGGKISLGGIKWDHLFWNILEGGGTGGLIWADGDRDGGYGFVGTELGWFYHSGNDVLILGAMVGLGAVLWQGHDDQDYEVLGANIDPIIRYRHYWGRFGLEVSLEAPLVIGGGDQVFATPMPILGLGFGM